MTITHTDIRIRRARLEDGAGLSALLRSIGWFPQMEAESEAATLQRVTRHLDACLESSCHSVYVAVGNRGQLVGYVSVHWLSYLFLPGPEGFVSGLFVAAPARGSGVGGSLLRAVEVEARAKGCFRLQVINRRKRESYRRGFYAKEGWRERSDGASFVKQMREVC
jgi:GNAT superfamily N-acetyltransferase